MNFQVKLQPNGDLQIKADQPAALQDIYEFLDLSKEKKKNTEILLNGQPVTNPATVINPKDRISVVIAQKYYMNEDTPLFFAAVPVVYEDDWCLVANKKPFLLVHGDGETEDTLTARVNAYLTTESWPFPAQPVNRIDYEASGLVLFCKYPLCQHFFDQQMEDGTAIKEYLAVIDGRVDNREIDINNPIGRNRHEADKMMVYKKGKPAHTHVTRLKLFNDKSLVKAAITTGRRHQIRVHLANLGYPIMNDALYGIVSNNKGLMLQAYFLSFEQPFTHERVDVQLDMDTRFKWFDPELANRE